MHLFARAGRAAALRTARTPARALSAEPPMALNDLAPNPGSNKRPKIRVGRGIGSGKGKTAGRGHKGTKARQGGSVRPGFAGGQTPLHKALPKVGFTSRREAFDVVNVGSLQKWIENGRLEPSDTEMLTMRDLNVSGLVNLKGSTAGVKLLGEGEITSSIHIEVSRASASAIKAVEDAGGTVTCAHYNRLALRALLHPEKFPARFDGTLALPRRARPPPKLMKYYVDGARRGEFSPEVQKRNRELGLVKLGPHAPTVLSDVHSAPPPSDGQ